MGLGSCTVHVPHERELLKLNVPVLVSSDKKQGVNVWRYVRTLSLRHRQSDYQHFQYLCKKHNETSPNPPKTQLQ